MYNGEPVYEGAAACSWDLPIGTQFTIPGDPTGRVYICKDRGILPDTHVDILAPPGRRLALASGRRQPGHDRAHGAAHPGACASGRNPTCLRPR